MCGEALRLNHGQGVVLVNDAHHDHEVSTDAQFPTDCYGGPNLKRYSAEFMKPFTIVRESVGFAFRKLSQLL